MLSHPNAAMNQVVEHLQQMVHWFNTSASAIGLDIALDAERNTLALRNPGMFYAADMMAAFAN
ncbi:hypothetical protein NIBR502774_12490 [Rhizobium sp. NIBRBAC000502774]|nr:hypothetical protein NIBR502774_12490 [Rhizobium sp. NIBRBAC000502774]